jgi:uncharacterized membrane protein
MPAPPATAAHAEPRAATAPPAPAPGGSDDDERAESELAALDPNVHNVQTLVDMHAESERAVGRHQRRIETLTATLGRPGTLYGLLSAVFLWVTYNLVAQRVGAPCPDPPPFPYLQGVVGLLALTMTSMVLITQNRQGKSAARRALLDLHVNLLSEQKVAKLIALLEELRRDLPSVGNRPDPQAEVMAQPLNAQAVISTLEAKIEQAISGQPQQPPAQAAVAAGLAANVAEMVREAQATGASSADSDRDPRDDEARREAPR